MRIRAATGYSEDVKGYRLLQPHSKNIIIRRDVKFHEDISACEPNLALVPSLACESSSTYEPSSPHVDTTPTLFTSLDDESEDENPPLPAQLPPAPTPPLLKC